MDTCAGVDESERTLFKIPVAVAGPGDLGPAPCVGEDIIMSKSMCRTREGVVEESSNTCFSVVAFAEDSIGNEPF